MTNPAIETIKTLLDKPEYRRAIGWKAIVELADRLDKLERAQTFGISQTEIDKSDDPKATVKWLKDHPVVQYSPSLTIETIETSGKDEGTDLSGYGNVSPFNKFYGKLAQENVVQYNHEPPFPLPKVDVSFAIRSLNFPYSKYFLLSYDEQNSLNAAIQVLKDYQRGNNGDNK